MYTKTTFRDDVSFCLIRGPVITDARIQAFFAGSMPEHSFESFLCHQFTCASARVHVLRKVDRPEHDQRILSCAVAVSTCVPLEAVLGCGIYELIRMWRRASDLSRIGAVVDDQTFVKAVGGWLDVAIQTVVLWCILKALEEQWPLGLPPFWVLAPDSTDPAFGTRDQRIALFNGIDAACTSAVTEGSV